MPSGSGKPESSFLETVFVHDYKPCFEMKIQLLFWRRNVAQRSGMVLRDERFSPAVTHQQAFLGGTLPT